MLDTVWTRVLSYLFDPLCKPGWLTALLLCICGGIAASGDSHGIPNSGSDIGMQVHGQCF